MPPSNAPRFTVRLRAALVAAMVATAAAAPAWPHDLFSAGAVEDYVARLARLTAEADATPEPRGAEAVYEIGVTVAQITNLLSLDLAAHGGEHGLLATVMLNELAKMGIELKVSPATRGYARYVAPFERYLALRPNGPRAAEARFNLITARFEEAVSGDPFSARGLPWSEVARQAEEGRAFVAAYPDFGNPAQREEIAFIVAVTGYRAYRAAPDPAIRAKYHAATRTALERFRTDYPDSLRRAAAELLLDALDAADDD